MKIGYIALMALCIFVTMFFVLLGLREDVDTTYTKGDCFDRYGNVINNVTCNIPSNNVDQLYGFMQLICVIGAGFTVIAVIIPQSWED